jgi:hypothetical protein
MDGERLQALIYAGYAKDAQHTGLEYSVYRPEGAISPLDASFLIGALHCRFPAEKKSEVPHKYKEPTYYLIADGRELQKGDFLVRDSETYFVADKQHLLPMQAVRCNDVVSIGRPRWVGTVTDLDAVATSYPVFRQLKKLDQKPVTATFGASTSATPIAEFFVYLPLAWTELRQGDIVTDSVNRTYQVSSLDPTEIGTVMVMRQSDHEQGES